MNKHYKIKSIISVTLVVTLIFSTLIFMLVSDNKEYSYTERRPLEQFPDLTIDNIINSSFMENFEEYSVDQFPFRDKYLKINALFNTCILGQKTVNDIYTYNGYVAELEYKINNEDLEYSINRITDIYKKHLKNSSVYFSIIPDKNYYLSKQSGYISLNYRNLENKLKSDLSFAEFIDIKDSLSLESYYKTDTHWKQEALIDTSNKILSSMGSVTENRYKINMFSDNFSGSYTGKTSFDLTPDKIFYLTNDVLENVTVTSFDNGIEEIIPLYNFEKGHGNDPYELYLSGSLSLITIDNKMCANNKELIIFRDSFGSSLAPLLVPSYKKVTLIDTRYITPSVLSKFVNFDNTDVLFLYSSTVLNNSIGQFLP